MQRELKTTSHKKGEHIFLELEEKELWIIKRALQREHERLYTDWKYRNFHNEDERFTISNIKNWLSMQRWEDAENFIYKEQHKEGELDFN